MYNDTSGNSGSGGRRGRVLPGILGAVHDNIRTFPEGIETKEGVFSECAHQAAWAPLLQIRREKPSLNWP
jgi:hypothetical protein